MLLLTSDVTANKLAFLQNILDYGFAMLLCLKFYCIAILFSLVLLSVNQRLGKITTYQC